MILTWEKVKQTGHFEKSSIVIRDKIYLSKRSFP